MNYETIKVRYEDSVCYIQFDRPREKNTINDRLISEFNDALRVCQDSSAIVVLSGSAETFCFGADFRTIGETAPTNPSSDGGPGPLYDLWLRLATGPYVTIAHVRGKVNAGGVGFVAACDIVLADDTAVFSLSEMLFGLFPACVLPFLIRRVGFQRANYLTLMTQPISVKQAQEWGLVDTVETSSEGLLRRHLLRLTRLSKVAIRRYKSYVKEVNGQLEMLKAPAVAANLEIFADPENLLAISRYVKTGMFPWEK